MRPGGSRRCSTTHTTRPARSSGLFALLRSPGTTESALGRHYANSWSMAFFPGGSGKSTLNKVNNKPRLSNFVPVAFKNSAPHVVTMAAAHPNRRPLLALVLLSPVIAEMLSGSTPPLEWLNPIAALLLIWLYGAGVLVMRETAVRWKTGWPSILLLGAAYGIIEEGLAVKSFFDPGWMDLETLAWYGRWFDVNWVWAVWLTIYHAVVSIAIPIFLVEWIWPRTRGIPLTSRRDYITAIALLAGAMGSAAFRLRRGGHGLPHRPRGLPGNRGLARHGYRRSGVRVPAGPSVSKIIAHHGSERGRPFGTGGAVVRRQTIYLAGRR